MFELIIFKCFLVGLLSSASFGPIFVLTFNRGAIYGFSRGFATALGACCADGIYFFLGLIGVLAFLQELKSFMILLDLFGSGLLIFLGIYFFKKTKESAYKETLVANIPIQPTGFFITAGKSFFLTIFNPLVFIFFMFISVQVLPVDIYDLSLKQVFLCSIAVSLGSLGVLSIVSLIASFLGSCISEKKLRLIQFFSAVIFLLMGFYLLIKPFLVLLNKFHLFF